ncbi:hypothetical protein CDCA_CDCA06G1963 [Cyanidium caldarium]|uniref:Uncharacterized protein n=1 Tax=Cyanidium caldarium TaxID=2771 RepID=A0AAV9IVW3_CYACA|nr:hypothetical protein CDCA_CDCA06G1963 [Cyanidium caldarium]
MEGTPFLDMPLKADLIRGIVFHGFISASRVQASALPPILNGRDAILCDANGVGKTTLVAIATLQLVATNRCTTQALLLSPTRELAQQTARLIEALGGRYLQVRCLAITGGRSLQSSTSPSVARGTPAHVISGTPGRVLDLVRTRGASLLRHVRLVVIDEADEMVSSGLHTQLLKICHLLPSDCQKVLVSATYGRPEVDELMETLLRDPVSVNFAQQLWSAPRNVQQYFVPVQGDAWKLDATCDIYDRVVAPAQSMIFVNACDKAEWLHRKLAVRGFTAGMLHGEMGQRDRENAARDFRRGHSRLLVATDVVGRGFDVASVSLVINYDLPVRGESYVHRVGRCGRFGRNGVAISIVNQEEVLRLRDIEKQLDVDVKLLPNAL